MKRLLLYFLIHLVAFSIVLYFFFWKYNQLQQEYVTRVEFSIDSDQRICFDYSGMIIYYQGHGEDSIQYTINYKMDSLEWLALKASGEDMRIKDAICIRNTFMPSRIIGYAAPDTPPVWRVDTDVDSIHASAVHYDLDFTKQPNGTLGLTYRGNIFGNNAKNFYVTISYQNWKLPFLADNAPDNLNINMPPDIKIQATPQYTDRNTEQVEFSKEDLVNIFSDGIYIEGHNPHLAQKYDNYIFFLGAILGGLLSWLVSCCSYYPPKIWKSMKLKMRRKKTVASEDNDDRSVADAVENNMLITESDSGPETEEASVPPNE